MADRNRGRRKPGRGRESAREERPFVDRAQDEVRSWLGDENAARRRHRDVMDPGQERPAARGARAPLGMAYGDRGRGQPRRSPPPQAESQTEYRRDPPGMSAPGEPRWREYDPSGATYRGWNEPNYGYRPAAGYDYETDPGAEPGWDARSVSGYGVRWRGRPGPYAGRGPKGYQRTDARVLEDVCDRLADAPDVDAGDIEVEVREGEVTISGTVRDRWQKRRAEDVIEHVSGVREVHNRLRVVSNEPAR